MDNYKIGILTPSRNDEDMLNNLFWDDIQSERLIVEVLGPGSIAEQGKKMIAKGVKAILARGGIFHELSDSITEIPIIRLDISANDILASLSEAKRYKKIHIMLREPVVFEFEKNKSLFNVDISCYKYESQEELKNYIDNLPYDPEMVILGGSITVSYAQKRGLNAIYIKLNPSSVLNTYNSIKFMLKKTRRENRELKLLESLISHIDDGVIVIDKGGRIIHFNRRSEVLLKKISSQMLNADIKKVLPRIWKFVLKYRKTGISSNEILRLEAGIISANISSIYVDEGESLEIITMKDVSKLQKLETSLRFKLNKKGLTAKYTFDDILTVEDSMLDLIERAKKCALTDNTILIYGQSGTGKELFAQSIHNYSGRHNYPFVAINCAALNESLLESELFGYEGGSFTGAKKEGKTGLFELAHGGTIFLDEINSMSPSMQSKILRVIEQKEVMRIGSDRVIPVNVRIICTSNENLLQKVKEGKFRMDLFFRINTLELQIPPLSERKKDILFLFRHFVASISGKDEISIHLDSDFKKLLLGHNWYGNIRELKNVATKYVLFNGDNKSQEILPFANKSDNLENVVDEDMKIDLKEINKVVDDLVIESLLNKGLTKTDTAKALGISRTALFKKMSKNKTDK